MDQPKDAFDRIRGEVEAADDELIVVLERRLKAVLELRRLREHHPEEYLMLESDEAVLRRLSHRSEMIPPLSLEAVMCEVLSACSAQLSPVSIAAEGPTGSFAHLAARERFGRSAELRALDDTKAVLDEVQRGRSTYGVVLLETTSDGAVTATLHNLVEADVKICGELTVPVNYHLFAGAPSGSALGGASEARHVTEVFATPAAIAACERQLRTHFPNAQLTDVASAEVAASQALRNPGTAVVGSRLLSGTPGLELIRERVEDNANVHMRFAIVGAEMPSRTGSDRTIVAVAVHDEPGALLQAIQPFADKGLNLTRLELRPSPSAELGMLFFVEIDGHITDRSILTAVDAVRSTTRYLKVLGSFPSPRP